MKTSFHRSLVTALIAAVCVAPAAFAKPHGEDDQQQGPPGAPGNPGKGHKKGQAAPQAPAAPQNAPGNARPQAAPQPARTAPQGSGPGAGVQSQRGPGIEIQGRRGPGVEIRSQRGPGLNVFIPPPPIPPAPYARRTYRRSTTSVADNGVAAVQGALKQRGYYRGGVDGDSGPGTRSAIVGFREDNGLGSSSRIDEPLLRALGL